MGRKSTKKPKEAMKEISKEREESDWDDYFELLEGGIRVNIKKVASDEERKKFQGGRYGKS